MCDIAPFGMKCEWEDVKDKLFMCNANRLNCALTELVQSIPIVGRFVEPYRCVGFEIPCGERKYDNAVD